MILFTVSKGDIVEITNKKLEPTDPLLIIRGIVQTVDHSPDGTKILVIPQIDASLRLHFDLFTLFKEESLNIIYKAPVPSKYYIFKSDEEYFLSPIKISDSRDLKLIGETSSENDAQKFINIKNNKNISDSEAAESVSSVTLYKISLRIVE